MRASTRSTGIFAQPWNRFRLDELAGGIQRHARACGRGLRRGASQEIEFYVYCQWLAQSQLHAAQGLALELGMPIGLYGDYAVGANPSGSETWADPRAYRMGAEIGAPPDPLALRGQGWEFRRRTPASCRRKGWKDSRALSATTCASTARCASIM